MKTDLQLVNPPSQDTARPVHARHQPLEVVALSDVLNHFREMFEPIPRSCTLADVLHHLNISERRFYRLNERKLLSLVELHVPEGKRRWCGESVARQLKLWKGRR